jgi:hypothetical protein
MGETLMWKNIFESLLKSIAHDDPALVDQLAVADKGFLAWSKFFNPNDIGNVEKGEKIIVKMLSEDLQEIKMRSFYYRYLIKKSDDYKLNACFAYFYAFANLHFWFAVRCRYKIWDEIPIGVRDGWKIVVASDNVQQLPDIIRKLMGG